MQQSWDQNDLKDEVCVCEGGGGGGGVLWNCIGHDVFNKVEVGWVGWVGLSEER